MALRDQDFEMHQGEDRQLDITVYDSLDAERDVTGCTGIFVLTRRWADDRVLEGDLDCSTGIAVGTISAEDSADLTGHYRLEARITDAQDNESVISVGTVTVLTSTTIGGAA